MMNAYKNRDSFFPLNKHLDLKEFPENSVYSVAYNNMSKKYLKHLSDHVFKSFYKIIAFKYYVSSQKEFTDEDIANIYFSGLDERLIFEYENFDEVLNWSEPSDEFFQKISNVKWTKSTLNFAKQLARLKMLLESELTGVFRIFQTEVLSLMEEEFIELIAGSSAVNDNREYLSKEDVLIGYKTYLKLLNTDITKYKAKLPDIGGNVSKGYLICDKCGGYYILQPGESPDDFSTECECGGRLEYFEPDNSTMEMDLDQYRRKSLKNIIQLNPKLELRLFSVILFTVASVELIFGVSVILGLNQHTLTSAMLLMLIMAFIMGPYFLITGIISFFKLEGRIYWLHVVAFLLILIQYSFLFFIFNSTSTSKYIIGTFMFIYLIVFFVRKATRN